MTPRIKTDGYEGADRRQYHDCKHEAELAETGALVREIHRRLFVDNGKDSVQTSLTKGVARFDALELAMELHKARQSDHDALLRAHAEQLADLEKQKQRVIGATAILSSIVGAVAIPLGKLLLTKIGGHAT